MKKIVRLTESELKNIVEASVKRAIQEGAVDEGFGKDVAKAVGTGVLGAGLGVAGVGTGLFDDQMDAIDNNSRAFPEDKAEFGDRLKPTNSIPSQAELPADTISWKKANHMESRIRRAVMESIMNLMNEGQA